AAPADGQTDEQEAAVVEAEQAVDDAPAEPRLAFVSDQDGNGPVYVMDADGSNRQKISEPSLRTCLYPTWSPDEQHVVYWGTEKGTFTGNSIAAGVWVSAADGEEHVRVNQDVTDVLTLPPPIWSPDGTRVVFVGGNSADDGSTIHVAWADGSGIERSIALPWEIQSLAWSPVGDDLLFVSKTARSGEGSAHVWSSGTGEITEIFAGTETADWSPDGDEFVVGDIAENMVAIVKPGQEPRSIFQGERGVPLVTAWSPDGTWVAIGTGPGDRRGTCFPIYPPTSLYIVMLESGEVATITERQGRIQHANWTSDGSRLLYTFVNLNARPGGYYPWANLWSYDATSGELTQVTGEEGFAGLGHWSH
ncbi:MAG: hypothetical protein GY842_16655, partial [bacterium]|nr:hypothetical protein [bacterium]